MAQLNPIVLTVQMHVYRQGQIRSIQMLVCSIGVTAWMLLIQFVLPPSFPMLPLEYELSYVFIKPW